MAYRPKRESDLTAEQAKGLSPTIRNLMNVRRVECDADGRTVTLPDGRGDWRFRTVKRAERFATAHGGRIK